MGFDMPASAIAIRLGSDLLHIVVCVERLLSCSSFVIVCCVGANTTFCDGVSCEAIDRATLMQCVWLNWISLCCHLC